MLSKIGTGASGRILEDVYYYDARTNFLNQGLPLSIQPFNIFGAARPTGNNKPRENQWSGRTYLDNGYNTGNPLTPGNEFERQDVTRNVFFRDYYINITDNIVTSEQIYRGDALFNFTVGNSTFDSTSILTPGEAGEQQEARQLRIIGGGTNVTGLYIETSSDVYTSADNNFRIEKEGTYWKLKETAFSSDLYESSDYTVPPWEATWVVGNGNGIEPPPTVENDIREFTFQPLIDFVAATAGVELTQCNIFATLCFDQYCILGTRWGTPPPEYGINTRQTTQRVPFADLAWPGRFRVYYKKIIPVRT